MDKRLANYVIFLFTTVFSASYIVDIFSAEFSVPAAMYPIMGVVVGGAVGIKTILSRKGQDSNDLWRRKPIKDVFKEDEDV